MAATLELSRRALDAYGQDLGAVSQDAVADLVDFLSDYDLAEMGPEAREGLRDATIAKVAEILDDYGDASASVGADLIDALLDKAGDGGLATMPAAVDRRRVGKAVRRCAADLFGEDADIGRFAGGVSEFVARTVSHRADDCVAESAVAANEARTRRGRKGGMRFARVPSGPSCGFCIMLASRGFVYATRESAGGMSRWHNDCDCRIVAGYDGMRVEGYDPDGMYERYRSCRGAIRADAKGSPVFRDWDRLPAEERAKYFDPRDPERKPSYDRYLAHRVTEEMDTRDRRWLYDGTLPKTTYAKQRDALYPHEQAAVSGLQAAGFRVTTIMEDPKARANLDILIGDVPWEMKSVSNADSSLSNQIKRARIKWFKLGGDDAMRVVITCDGCKDNPGTVLAGVQSRLRPGEEAIVISAHFGGYEAYRVRP